MAYQRIFNFSAGPSMLPEPVLEQARDDLMNYGNSGMSVMEMSHRSKEYEAIMLATQQSLREVMNIPDNYKVLFLQGGASMQFCMAPMNLLRTGKADYIVSGYFSNKAYQEACKFSDGINLAASSKESDFSRIPVQEELKLDPDADYLHLCFNNTIYGTTFPYIPQAGDVPLVADISSFILSQPLDISKFGIVYAGAQKNVAPAGLTIAIIREDLLGFTLPGTPSLLDYDIHVKNNSMYNTPPCYCIYICKLVLDWIQSLGGLTVMQEINRKKAELLYDFIDSSKLFIGTADKGNRSMMNVTFKTNDPVMDAKFVKESEAAGLTSLKGHRAVGGMRASIYNAMPLEGVEKLVSNMAQFEQNNR